MKMKVLIHILPSFFKFSIFPSVILIWHIWIFFIKVFSETTWFRIMKSLTILSFLWKCYNLWWLPPGVCELCSLLAIFFQWIFFILAGNKVSHKSLDGFEFRQDSITDLGVSCPWASWKLIDNVVTTLTPLFLIGSSSFLQVTRTTIELRLEFENRADQTMVCGVSCPWTS